MCFSTVYAVLRPHIHQSSASLWQESKENNSSECRPFFSIFRFQHLFKYTVRCSCTVALHKWSKNTRTNAAIRIFCELHEKSKKKPDNSRRTETKANVRMQMKLVCAFAVRWIRIISFAWCLCRAQRSSHGTADEFGGMFYSSPRPTKYHSLHIYNLLHNV